MQLTKHEIESLRIQYIQLNFLELFTKFIQELTAANYSSYNERLVVIWHDNIVHGMGEKIIKHYSSTII